MFFKNNMKELSGWGRYPKIKTKELIPNSQSELIDILSQSKSYIPRGKGMSYGDSAVNKDLTITMTKFNRYIEWNQKSGELIAESGVTISDIIKTFLPRGWFPYVTPGAKLITLGGAIACDVHGKNHHIDGSFGDFVNWIDIVNDKNKIIRCSRSKNAELFNWTIGGMGLTGIIVRCSIQLKKVKSGWIRQKNVTNNNLKETFESFHTHRNATYSVAWIDCLASGRSLGRSILMLGEHADESEVSKKLELFPKKRNQKISFFFDLPSFLLNNLSISIFNNIYFNLNKRDSDSYVDWDTYFYPLDSIGNWNRLYGKRGFFQFQCVLPNESSEEGYIKILSVIQKKTSGSFLAVLKQFGSGNKSLSFPKEGFTLALDFKAIKKNIKAANELTKIVNDLGGKIYLAKDAIMNSKQFEEQINEKSRLDFSKFRNESIRSMQSQRLKI